MKETLNDILLLWPVSNHDHDNEKIQFQIRWHTYQQLRLPQILQSRHMILNLTLNHRLSLEKQSHLGILQHHLQQPTDMQLVSFASSFFFSQRRMSCRIQVNRRLIIIIACIMFAFIIVVRRFGITGTMSW